MSSAETLFAQWKQHVPNDAAVEDVRKVVVHFLGTNNIGAAHTGSHQIIVSGEIMDWAYKLRNQGHSPLAWVDGPCFTIPAHKGRTVKKIYIEKLIKLIDFSIELKKLLSKGQ